MQITILEVLKPFTSKSGKNYWKIKLADGSEGACNFEPKVGENEVTTWDKTPGIYYAPRDRKYIAATRTTYPRVEEMDQGKEIIRKLDIILDALGVKNI